MPRPTRHVSYESPSKQQPIPSPVRKMNRPRKPRDSDASSTISDDEPPSPPGSPYSSDSNDRRPLPKSSKSKAAAQKDSLKKQAMHNRRSISGNYSQSQTIHHTPRQVSLRDPDDSSSIPSNLQVVGTALTPASKKPIPILSNFEDWLKLATDNKINATNSWNFALIDYFHEMSLLRDEGGKGINFQKASCTLDGCVKIYGARVESVGVEAGRLLSGLATTKDDEGGKKKRRGGEDGDDEDGSDADGSGGEESDGEGGKKKKEKKRKARSHEATLAPSFASLQLKKLELEFAVDPLFKKASADFDEGGAKGLLLNHLSINEEGRIVFDSSDDATDTAKKEERQPSAEPEDDEDKQDFEKIQATTNDIDTPPEDPQQTQIPEDAEIDLNLLATKFLPDLAILDNLDICPSMKNFKLGDPTAALSIPLLQGDNNDWKNKNPSPEKQQAPPQIDGELADQSGLFIDGSNGIDFDDDDGIGGFDVMGEEEVGFGQGGEAWAREAAVEPMLRPTNGADGEDIDAENEDGYALAMAHRYQEDAEQEHMMDFFSKAVNTRAKVGSKGFTSITNWRIQRIQQKEQAENAPPEKKARKEKEPFKIDFYGPISDNLKKLLAEKSVANEKISLPKTQLKTKGRNLLDKDDEVIDVKSMLRLWTKPKCRVVRKKGVMSLVDDGFGSKAGQQAMRHDKDGEEDDDTGRGDYDANFFADDDPLGLPFYDGPLPIDDDDDDDQGGDQPGFVDAREMLSPPPDQQHPQQGLDEIIQQGDDQDQPPLGLELPTASQQNEMLPGSFGSQLVTQQGRRLRPEYVNYARTAKKVDVRALKENMWKGMSSRLNIFPDPDRIPTPELTDGDGDTDMMDADAEPPEPAPVPEIQLPQKEDEVLKFTDILGGLKSVYPETQMKDISTSYGFICLLHLANEKGLLLEGGRSEGLMEEILVRRDGSVGEGYVGE